MADILRLNAYIQKENTKGSIFVVLNVVEMFIWLKC